MKYCRNCKYWKNQNIKGKHPIVSMIEGKGVGACAEILKGFVTTPETGMFKTENGVTVVKYVPVDINVFGLVYTVEDFVCGFYKRLRPIIPTRQEREEFVNKYMFVCNEAYRNGGYRLRCKTVSGKVLCDIARKYFESKPTTIDSDIFMAVYHAYCRVTGKKRNYSSSPFVWKDGREEDVKPIN